MNRRKLFLLTMAVLLISTACSGPFLDPGMMDALGGGGGSNSEGGAKSTCHITFDINGGTGTAPKQIKAKEGSEITLPDGSGFSMSGYIFAGWNTSSSGMGTSYNAGAVYTVYDDKTFYAKWNDNSAGSETSPIPLTAGTWTDGSITSTASGSAIWYSFSVTQDSTYYVWWNDSGQGNGAKTLDVKVTAYYSNGSSIFLDYDSAWSTPRPFIAVSSDTVKLKVVPYSSGNSGTFAITYNTNNTRPYAPTYYTVTFNSNGGSGTVPSQTVVSGTSITLPSGSGLSRTDYVFNGWNTNSGGTGTNYSAGSSYTVTNNVTLYAKWNYTGLGGESNPILMTADTWINGNITSNPNELWYSFSVTSGTTYYVWWNDSYEGNSTKTADIMGYAYYSDNTNIFSNIDNGWSIPQSFIATQNGTVKLKVVPYSSGSTGTFAIVYNTSGTRP
jgi:uncharacterized repeat protein (TIGR02543 family)